LDTLTRHTAEIDKSVTSYLASGDGPPLLMLHGWGASAELVAPLAQELAKRGVRCIMPDLPGFGQTPTPARAWTVHDYATWTLHLADALQIDTFDLFGHSFGGRLSLILAAQHPRRVRRVVLANSAGIRPPVPWRVRARTRLYQTLRLGLERVGLRATAHTLRQRYNARYGSSDFNALSGVMRQTFVQIVNEDLQSHARRLTQPTLLFWGDQDTDTPLWMGRALEGLIRDAALIVHAGAGHYSYLDRVKDTAHIMVHFLQN